MVVGDDVDKVYLVMEYMEHDLRSLMDKTEFSIGEVKCMCNQLLKGLDHLHNKNIFHRDLKPSNLLLNKKGVLKIG